MAGAAPEPAPPLDSGLCQTIPTRPNLNRLRLVRVLTSHHVIPHHLPTSICILAKNCSNQAFITLLCLSLCQFFSPVVCVPWPHPCPTRCFCRSDLGRLQVSELYMAFSALRTGSLRVEHCAHAAFPGQWARTGSTLCGSVRRDLGCLCCLKERGGRWSLDSFSACTCGPAAGPALPAISGRSPRRKWRGVPQPCGLSIILSIGRGRDRPASA